MSYTDLIDIDRFGDDHNASYHAFVWRDGKVEAYCACSSQQLYQVAAFCKRYSLPVVANSPQVRADLRAFGIDALLPRENMIGLPREKIVGQ
jgi:hypothetical protein